MTTLQKVQSGDSIRKHMRAATWNAFVDAAVAHRMRGGQKPGPGVDGGRFSNRVRIVNNSGADCDVGDVLGIDGLDTDFLASSGELEAYYRPILAGSTPTSEHKGKFAICTEQIPDGAIGYATTDGIALTRLANTNEDWETADVDPSDSTQLKLVADGSARVLWFDNWGTTGFETHGGDTIVTQGGDTLLDQAGGASEVTIALVRLGSPAVTISRLVAKADEDIEHDDYGTVEYQTGSTFDDDSISDTAEYVTVYNPGRKIWYGSRVIIGTTDLKDGASDYNVLSAWSASRVRGVAVGDITPGTTGTIGTLSPIDGHFGASTVQAYLPTANVEVAEGAVVWAELVYQESTGKSRWEIYSADCS